MSNYLCLVLAADAHDYVKWCRQTGRTPFVGSAWAISRSTGASLTGRRTFQATDRWRENKCNRRLVQQLAEDRPPFGPVPYGDEDGPWPSERIPDLSWPSRWRRIARWAP